MAYDHKGSVHVFQKRREKKAFIWIGIGAAVLFLLIIA